MLDESHASSPHLCLEYAASEQTYNIATQIVRIQPTGSFTPAAIGLLNVLVDYEEGDFLQSPSFANAVTDLAIQLATYESLEADTEATLFELLFSIAAKLKLQPQCVSHWFKPDQEPEARTHTGQPRRESPHSREEDFPLFYLLLNNVHQEDRVGEFARTGLLYLVESTAHSEALEKWIIESDLAALMASGLGALYSQLNRYSAFAPLSYQLKVPQEARHILSEGRRPCCHCLLRSCTFTQYR